jgi:gas vesicle protein
MELTPYLIGALIGGVLAFAFLYLFYKSKSVDRKEHDALSAKLNDASNNLKLAEERFKGQQTLSASLEQKFDQKQSELSNMLAKTASMEASLKSTMERFNEHAVSLSKEKEVNRDQQTELNRPSTPGG